MPRSLVMEHMISAIEEIVLVVLPPSVLTKHTRVLSSFTHHGKVSAAVAAVAAGSGDQGSDG